MFTKTYDGWPATISPPNAAITLFRQRPLVHEAYLRINRQTGFKWQNRSHFFAVAARAMLALDEALQRLALLRSREAQIVELKFFGGLSVEENAQILHTSVRTVKRDWNLTSAWLSVDRKYKPK